MNKDKYCDCNNYKKTRYFHGMLMTDQDFIQEQIYHNEKRKLLNSMLHGWGVVCGLDIRAASQESTKIYITPGLALDCRGNEIRVDKNFEVELKGLCESTVQEVENPCIPPVTPPEKCKYYVGIKFYEAKTDPVPVYTSSGGCEDKTCEYSRVTEGFCVKFFKGQPPQQPKPCTPDVSTLKPVCDQPEQEECDGFSYCYKNYLQESDCYRTCLQCCPECCIEEHYIILGCIDLTETKGKITRVKQDDINTGKGRTYVTNMQTLLCLLNSLPYHYNYIGTWLVLGPVFNPDHQKDKQNDHKEGKQNDNDHPLAAEIIEDISYRQGDSFNPIEITSSSLANAPNHGDKADYRNDALFGEGSDPIKYLWKTRGFSNIDWMNIHDIEDNIHRNLPGDTVSGVIHDPFNPHTGNDNFAGKHHALAFFLTYIWSPEERTTNLYVRSDDSIRVWLNGEELGEPIKYVSERNIRDYYKESCRRITLKEKYNVLMVAVSHTHVEWGFSVRIKNDKELRFTTINPERPIGGPEGIDDAGPELLQPHKSERVTEQKDTLTEEVAKLSVKKK